MYTKSANCGVTSTLCYGVQWDAVMQFIDSNYLWKTGETDNVVADSFVRNSSNKGNYDETGSGEWNLALTGSNPDYQINHIYDLAGNVCELTMEAFNTGDRVLRGSYYVNTGLDGPTSCRSISSIHDTSNDDCTGFRLALYV